MDSVVDEFVIIESRRTFSGYYKPELFFEKNYQNIKHYSKKIKFFVVDEIPDPTDKWLKKNRKNRWMHDKEAWFRENYQRDYGSEYILKKYEQCVIIGTDLDEIPKKDVVSRTNLESGEVRHLEMDLFYYNANWKKKSTWNLGFICDSQALVNQSLSEIRIEGKIREKVLSAGWHFSYFLSLENISNKIRRAAHTEFDKPKYYSESNIKKCISNGKDLFGRAWGEKLNYFTDIQELPIDFQNLHNEVLELQKEI
ncbi:MAG: hypothetical protein RJQ09_02680 [Cyclobacteriaceae bacterium]